MTANSQEFQNQSKKIMNIYLKSILKITVLLVMLFTSFSCSKEDEVGAGSTAVGSEALPVQTFSNLYSPGSGIPPNTAGEFIKFNFATNSVVTSGDNWDVAFRTTTILVNGGVAAPGQPVRTGIGAAFIATGTFANITTAPEDSLFKQDNGSVNAIVTGSGNGWYNYSSVIHVVTPIAGKVIIIKTHDGKYAKMEILSYYKDAPANPTMYISTPYYKFNFVYQPNGTKKF